MTLSLATRNLLRNRRRSLATLLALAIGAASVLLFGGYSADIRYSLLTQYVQTGGHLQVQHKDFFLFGNGNPTAYGIPGYDKLLNAIRDDVVLKPLMRVATPTLQFGGIAGNYDAGVSRTVIGMGYVAEDVSRMREWNEYRLPQETAPYALLGAPEDSAIVGIGVARVLLLCDKLGVKGCPRPAAEERPSGTGGPLPPDIAELSKAEASSSSAKKATGGKAKIELLAGQARGSPNVASLNIATAEDQGFKELDEVTVILQMSQAQKLVYGRSEPRATLLIVQLEQTGDLPKAIERVQAIVKEHARGQALAVLDFQALNPFYGETLQLFDTIFGFIFVLIGAIVLFTVSNTMTAAVMERTTEIGTVRAVGLRQKGVRRLFVTEGLMLGCVGAIVGVLAALVVSGIVNHMHLTWLPPGSSTPLPLTVRVWGEVKMMIGTTIGLIIIAALSAWWPAWRAAKLKIVDALRHA